jgi:hypothetical protein
MVRPLNFDGDGGGSRWDDDFNRHAAEQRRLRRAGARKAVARPADTRDDTDSPYWEEVLPVKPDPDEPDDEDK